MYIESLGQPVYRVLALEEKKPDEFYFGHWWYLSMVNLHTNHPRFCLGYGNGSGDLVTDSSVLRKALGKRFKHYVFLPEDLSGIQKWRREGHMNEHKWRYSWGFENIWNGLGSDVCNHASRQLLKDGSWWCPGCTELPNKFYIIEE